MTRRLLLFIALLAGALLRIPYLLFWDLYYGADPALIHLIASHLKQGEFCFYNWGQGYHANLEPLLAAGLYRLWGDSPVVYSLVPFAFSLFLIAACFLYVERIAGLAAAFVSALLLAFASPYFISFTIRPGDYVEILLLGIVQFRAAPRLLLLKEEERFLFLLAGFSAGFAWFYFRLILVFWLALLIWILALYLTPNEMERWRGIWKKISPGLICRRAILLENAAAPSALRRLLVFVNLYNCGNSLVAAFLWFHGSWIRTFGTLTVKLHFWPIFKSSAQMALAVLLLAQRRFFLQRARAAWRLQPLRWLLGGFLLGYSPTYVAMLFGEFPDSRSGVATLPEFLRNLGLIARGLLPEVTGNGGQPFLYIVSLLLATAGFILLLARFILALRRKIAQGDPLPADFLLLSLLVATLLLGLSYDRLGDLSTLRYLAPVWIVVPFGVALLLGKIRQRIGRAAWLVLIPFLWNALLAHAALWREHKSRHPYENVLQTLKKNNVRGGFSPYPYAYALTALSREEVIVAPLDGPDRYPAFTRFVRSLDRIAWIGAQASPDATTVLLSADEYAVEGREVSEGLPILYLSRKRRP